MTGLSVLLSLWIYEGFTKLKAGESWAADILKGDQFNLQDMERGGSRNSDD